MKHTLLNFKLKIFVITLLLITIAAPQSWAQRSPLGVGDRAPDFTLTTRDGKYRVKLSSYKNKKPVVLIFGSYT